MGEWESYIGKKVRIVKTDGFIKYGIFESHDSNFIFLRFDDGTLTMINKSSVSSLEVIS